MDNVGKNNPEMIEQGEITSHSSPIRCELDVMGRKGGDGVGGRFVGGGAPIARRAG